MSNMETEKRSKGRSEPLYKNIAATLRDEIRTRYSPNDLLPTQRELAQRFKTSYMTVGNALQQLVQEGLVTRTVGTGTFVRDPQTVSRGLIGVMNSCADDIYMAKLFGTIERELREARYRPIIFGCGLDYQETLNTINELGRFNEAGLILYSSFVEKLVEDVDVLRRQSLPVVTINWPLKDFDCSRVDHRMIGILQARHVLERGCRRILYIDTADLSDRRYGDANDDAAGSCEQVPALPVWLEGFMSTMTSEGNGAPAVRVVTARYSEDTDSARDVAAKRYVRATTEAAFAQAGGFAPDALVVYGDRYLPVAVETLRAIGREPGRDVVLVGADNQTLRGFPYATIDECLNEIGHNAARLLLDRIEGRYTGPQRVHMVTPKLMQYE